MQVINYEILKKFQTINRSGTDKRRQKNMEEWQKKLMCTIPS